jgi:helicase
MLPEWLDYAFGENIAASMFRGLQGRTASWGELVATAQAVIGYYQDDLTPETINSFYEQERVLPLIAASRILDSASQLSTGDDFTTRLSLGLTSAVAFGMYGNFLSSAAVIKRLYGTAEDTLSIEPGDAAIVATAAPSLTGKVLQFCQGDSPEQYYLELLEQFLRTGGAEQIGNVRAALINCIINASSSFRSGLLRSARVCLEHIFNLSVAKTLNENCSNLPAKYISRLVDRGVRLLLPPQYKAIIKHDVVNRLDNTIISLPTSTGKTLLGELSLVGALTGPGLVCYLAPYVALGRQVMRSFEDHLPETFRLHLMVGTYRAADELRPEINREVVIATPERMDALMRLNPDLIQHIRCVVCDEAHLIQSGTRGIKLEGLLTRLRLLQVNGVRTRLVLLSAVLSQYEKLQDWIGAPDDAVITNTWKPTARRLAIWKQEGQLIWYVGDEPVRRPAATSESVIGKLILPWPQRNLHASNHFGQVRSQEPLVNNNIAYLAEFLLEQYGEPILCVCATKRATRNVAVAIANRLPEGDLLDQRISQIIFRIKSSYPYLRSLAEMLRRGVAFHNSTVPHEIRLLIEDAAKAKLLKVVVSTTTLAEGVDLPFRFTILVDWLLEWQGDEPKPISSLLFRNIAGRCGRAGEFTEGDTIVFDNPVGDENYTHISRRDQYHKDIFLGERPGELTSTIEQIIKPSTQREHLRAALASQFMASIPENPNTDNLAESFYQKSYAHKQLGTASPAKNIFKNIESSLLDETNGALAKAASPLRLTDLGVAANDSGFSPESCRLIMNFLRNLNEEPEYVSLICTLLREFGQLPEQTDPYLNRVLSPNSKHIGVRNTDLERVTTLWLKGTSEETIFAGLPSVRQSKRAPKVDEWLAGEESSDWNSSFDKFIDFMSTIYESYLPWLIRACNSLSTPFVEDWAFWINWSLLAEMVEHGVDTMWAVSAINLGAPKNREAIAIAGRAFNDVPQTPDDPLGLNSLFQPSFRRRTDALFREMIAQAREPRTYDLRNLYHWLCLQAGARPTIL